MADRDYLSPFDRAIASANRHRLLPESYLYGLAHARLESRARPAFLHGAHSLRGFRSFFLWTFVLKTPLVSLIAVAAAIALAAPRARWVASAFLLLPVLWYFGFAVTSHLNIGHRHLLPVYPFLFVLCGGLVPVDRGARKARRWVLPAATIAVVAIGSTVVFWPPWKPTFIGGRPLEYFNEFAGGPQNGFRSLVDSNLDWGQGLKDLAGWLYDRGIDEPINLCYFGTADPRFYQIRHVRAPCEYMFAPPLGPGEPFPPPIAPGYLAISATHLQGERDPPVVRVERRALLERAELVDRVGHGLFVFRLIESGGDS